MAHEIWGTTAAIAVRFGGKADGGAWYTKRMRIDPAKHGWMTAPETQAVMQALGEARFVGGAVRNALLGVPVIGYRHRRADAAGRERQAAGSGGHQGRFPPAWITAPSPPSQDGKVFEVTSLRRDVATDGRHAVVAYHRRLGRGRGAARFHHECALCRRRWRDFRLCTAGWKI